MDCSWPGSSVHGILQARRLEWVVIPFSRGSSQPRDLTWVSRIAGRFFTIWTTREAHSHWLKWLSLKSPQTINVGESMAKREPSYIVGGNVNWCSHQGKQYGGSLKTKNKVTVWSSNSTPGHISRENSNLKRCMHLSVHSTTVYNSQDIEATWIPINGWMNEEDMVYIYHGILLSHKKEWDYAICSNMDEPRDYHTKCSKTEKEKYHNLLICKMQNIVNIDLFTEQKQTHKHRKLMVTKGEGQAGKLRLGSADSHDYI